MQFFRSPIRLVMAALAAAFLLAGPAPAQVKLLMFQQEGCPWCAKWNAAIAPIYPKTAEGKEAPLQRLDIHNPLPAGLALKGMPQVTPTFVLVQDGKELGRIQGYPGPDFFWALLDELLRKVATEPTEPAEPAAPKSAATGAAPAKT